jgi:hypothetical protein
MKITPMQAIGNAIYLIHSVDCSEKFTFEQQLDNVSMTSARGTVQCSTTVLFNKSAA